jgi:hypothetical protein
MRLSPIVGISHRATQALILKETDDLKDYC